MSLSRLVEALLADLQSVALPPTGDDRRNSDRSSLVAHEWPSPPPPSVEGEQTDNAKVEEPDAPQKESGGTDGDKEEGVESVEEKPPPVPPLPKEFQQGPTMKPYPSGPTSTSANLAELDNLLEALNISAPTSETESAGEIKYGNRSSSSFCLSV